MFVNSATSRRLELVAFQVAQFNFTKIMLISSVLHVITNVIFVPDL